MAEDWNELLTQMNHKPYGIYEKYIKRPLDAFLSAIGLVVLSPVIAVVAICVKIDLGKPVIFKQKRLGYKNSIFTIYKFRSMKGVIDHTGKELTEDERQKEWSKLSLGFKDMEDKDRVTKFGAFIRKTSLDELPQLINVVKGDLSIVGPRPLHPFYIDYYTEEEKMRHEVRPGMTGLAQIKGRNRLSWDEKFAYDIEYTKNISFFGDMAIIFKTFFIIFHFGDIRQGDEKRVPLHVWRGKRSK